MLVSTRQLYDKHTVLLGVQRIMIDLILETPYPYGIYNHVKVLDSRLTIANYNSVKHSNHRSRSK